ncbi:MAG: hypothetical protein L0H38_03280 [bacterium]|nr:hypothetical protein [bacterium]
MIDGNKHNKLPDSHYVHSSAYAQLSQGGKIGSTDHTTFRERLAAERFRQHIDPYKSSTIGNNINDRRHPRSGLERPKFQQPKTEREKTIYRPEGQPIRPEGIGLSKPQQQNSDSQPRARFQEPKSRGYDPYR